MTNKEISINFDKMINAFEKDSSYRPAKISFKIQKNIRKLYELVEEIDKAKQSIGEQYGAKDKDGYHIPPENVQKAQQEIDDLMSIEQEVSFLTISLSEIENMDFTLKQMDALMFMVTE